MRRLAPFAAAALAAGALVSSAPSAVAASCVATGASMTLDQGLHWSSIRTAALVRVELRFGDCAGRGLLEWASCDAGAGLVQIGDRTVDLTWVAGVVVFGGEAAGAAVLTPDYAACSGPGEDTFTMTGALEA